MTNGKSNGQETDAEPGDRADRTTDGDLNADDLLAELAALRDIADTADERQQVEETMTVARELTEQGRLRRAVGEFDTSDAAESLLGSLLFGIPMAVEGGTTEVAGFLASRPVLLGCNVVATLALVAGLLYVADLRAVRVTDPLFGVLPRRFTGVVVVSAVTAVGLFSVWGRVSWANPPVAVATVAVGFVPMSIGAALGDLLPEPK